MKNQSIENFILTLSESQKLYNLRNKRKPNKHQTNRKSKIYKQTQPTQPKPTKPTNTTIPKRIKPPLFYDSPLRGSR